MIKKITFLVLSLLLISGCVEDSETNAVNWLRLANFPSACPPGYVIQDLNRDSYTCVLGDANVTLITYDVNSAVTGLFAGTGIDVNANTGDVNVSIDVPFLDSLFQAIGDYVTDTVFNSAFPVQDANTLGVDHLVAGTNITLSCTGSDENGDCTINSTATGGSGGFYYAGSHMSLSDGNVFNADLNGIYNCDDNADCTLTGDINSENGSFVNLTVTGVTITETDLTVYDDFNAGISGSYPLIYHKAGNFSLFGGSATGLSSWAVNPLSESNGAYSFANGFGAIANSDYTIAMNNNAYANQNYAMAFGRYASADGVDAVAIGYGADANLATGPGGCVAIGDGAVCNELGEVTLSKDVNVARNLGIGNCVTLNGNIICDWSDLNGSTTTDTNAWTEGYLNDFNAVVVDGNFLQDVYVDGKLYVDNIWDNGLGKIDIGTSVYIDNLWVNNSTYLKDLNAFDVNANNFFGGNYYGDWVGNTIEANYLDLNGVMTQNTFDSNFTFVIDGNVLRVINTLDLNNSLNYLQSVDLNAFMTGLTFDSNFTAAINSLDLNNSLNYLQSIDLNGYMTEETFDANFQTAFDNNFNASTYGSTDFNNIYKNTNLDINVSDVNISQLNNPTWIHQEHYNRLFGSAGRATGGIISDAGGETVNVTAGTGFIKNVDDDTAELFSFDWDANNGIAIPTNSTRYIGVIRNGGNPVVDSRIAQDWDYDTEFPLGSIINLNGVLYILNNPWWITDGMTNIIEKSVGVGGYLIRDKFIGGLILGVTGTRNPTMSTGTIWGRLNEFEMSAIDYSIPTGTFNSYWFESDGTVHETTGLTQYSITQWNDVDNNTLTNIGNNQYANWWVFINATNNELGFIYPQETYSNSASAEAEEIPSNIPGDWYLNSLIIGRVLFKQGVDTPVEVQSVFTTQFTPAQATDHGNLAGLSDNDHPQYVLQTDGNNWYLSSSTYIPTEASIDANVNEIIASRMPITDANLDIPNVWSAIDGNRIVFDANGYMTESSFDSNYATRMPITDANLNVPNIWSAIDGNKSGGGFYYAGASLTLDDGNIFNVNDANLGLVFYTQSDANTVLVKLVDLNDLIDANVSGTCVPYTGADKNVDLGVQKIYTGLDSRMGNSANSYVEYFEKNAFGFVPVTFQRTWVNTLGSFAGLAIEGDMLAYGSTPEAWTLTTQASDDSDGIDIDFNFASDVVEFNQTIGTGEDEAGTYDLGKTNHEWKDAYLTGCYYINGVAVCDWNSMNYVKPSELNYTIDTNWATEGKDFKELSDLNNIYDERYSTGSHTIDTNYATEGFDFANYLLATTFIPSTAEFDSNFNLSTYGSADFNTIYKNSGGGTDTTLDDNVTAETSWLGKEHDFSAEQTMSAGIDLNYNSLLNLSIDANDFNIFHSVDKVFSRFTDNYQFTTAVGTFDSNAFLFFGGSTQPAGMVRTDASALLALPPESFFMKQVVNVLASNEVGGFVIVQDIDGTGDLNSGFDAGMGSLNVGAGGGIFGGYALDQFNLWCTVTGQTCLQIRSEDDYALIIGDSDASGLVTVDINHYLVGGEQSFNLNATSGLSTFFKPILIDGSGEDANSLTIKNQSGEIALQVTPDGNVAIKDMLTVGHTIIVGDKNIISINEISPTGYSILAVADYNTITDEKKVGTIASVGAGNTGLIVGGRINRNAETGSYEAVRANNLISIFGAGGWDGNSFELGAGSQIINSLEDWNNLGTGTRYSLLLTPLNKTFNDLATPITTDTNANIVMQRHSSIWNTSSDNNASLNVDYGQFGKIRMFGSQMYLEDLNYGDIAVNNLFYNNLWSMSPSWKKSTDGKPLVECYYGSNEFGELVIVGDETVCNSKTKVCEKKSIMNHPDCIIKEEEQNQRNIKIKTDAEREHAENSLVTQKMVDDYLKVLTPNTSIGVGS